IRFLHQTEHVQSLAAEADRPDSIEEGEDLAACRRGFGNMPLVVLAEEWVYSPTADEQGKEGAPREAERQGRLAGISSRGEKIDLDSGHLIPLERPISVIDAIHKVVLAVRQSP